jgi:hypothetical protein
MPKLARSLNRLVIVSIPAFFGDDAPRRCNLDDIEPPFGLWLSGDRLNDRLRKFEDAAPPDETLASVFFPFNQIVFLFDPAQFAYLARGPRARPKAIKPAESPKQSARTSRLDKRPSKKSAKPKR